MYEGLGFRVEWEVLGEGDIEHTESFACSLYLKKKIGVLTPKNKKIKMEGRENTLYSENTL